MALKPREIKKKKIFLHHEIYHQIAVGVSKQIFLKNFYSFIFIYFYLFFFSFVCLKSNKFSFYLRIFVQIFSFNLIHYRITKTITNRMYKYVKEL